MIVPHQAVADAVMENVRGQTLAQKLLHDISRGFVAQDALLHALEEVGNGERRRGFLRQLQKTLERALRG